MIIINFIILILIIIVLILDVSIILIFINLIMILLTYGIYRYFDYSWRKFHFIIISIGLIDFIIDLKFDWFWRYKTNTYEDPYF